jgi:hypothetical protein
VRGFLDTTSLPLPKVHGSFRLQHREHAASSWLIRHLLRCMLFFRQWLIPTLATQLTGIHDMPLLASYHSRAKSRHYQYLP